MVVAGTASGNVMHVGRGVSARHAATVVGRFAPSSRAKLDGPAVYGRDLVAGLFGFRTLFRVRHNLCAHELCGVRVSVAMYLRSQPEHRTGAHDSHTLLPPSLTSSAEPHFGQVMSGHVNPLMWPTRPFVEPTTSCTPLRGLGPSDTRRTNPDHSGGQSGHAWPAPLPPSFVGWRYGP
jgi:hypothetical protein